MADEPTYVWITTRRLKPGAYAEFSRAWRPDEIPEGMLRAFEYYADELKLEDAPFSWELTGNCAFATDFSYASG